MRLEQHAPPLAISPAGEVPRSALQKLKWFLPFCCGIPALRRLSFAAVSCLALAHVCLIFAWRSTRAVPVTGAAEPVVPRVAAHLEPPPSPPSPLPLQPSPDSGVQVAVVPVANAACIELDDLREQQARCQPSSGTLPTKATTAAAAAALPVPCPASLERECVRHRARPAARCAEARATTRPPLVVGWRQFVFAAATFEDEATAALLQAAADSWLQLARGAELLLATDADDGRSDAQIAPDTRGAVAVRIHRCSTCRGRRCARPPCDGRREGWLARTKLLSLDAKDMRPSVPASAGRLHTLGRLPGRLPQPPAQPPARRLPNGCRVLSLVAALAERYGEASGRRFFLKFDPDTVVVPTSLRRLARELHSLVDEGVRLIIEIGGDRTRLRESCTPSSTRG